MTGFTPNNEVSRAPREKQLSWQCILRFTYTYIAEVTTFASLIDACAKAGDLERAEKWMKDRALDEMASVSSRNDHLPRRVAL